MYEFIVENQTMVQSYEHIFNTIASLFGSATYLEIIKIAFLLGGFYTFVLMILSYLNINVDASPFKRDSIFVGYIFIAFALLTVTFSVDKVSIITKTSSLPTYCAKTAPTTTHSKVDNVPWLWAYIFTTINEGGHSLTKMATAVFGSIDGKQRGNYVDYIQSAAGILTLDFKYLGEKTSSVSSVMNSIKNDCILTPGSKTASDTNSIIYAVQNTGDIRRTLNDYFSDEAALTMYPNPTSNKAVDLGSAVVDGIKPKNFLMSVNGEIKTCGAVWADTNSVLNQLMTSNSLECSHGLKEILTPNNLAFFTGDKTATISTPQMHNILINAALLNTVLEKKYNIPSEISFATGKSIAQQTNQFVGTGFYMAKMIPILQMGLRAIFYAFIPFTFLVIIMPYGTRVLAQYLKSIIWVELWSPMAAILNMFILEGSIGKFYEAYHMNGINASNALHVYNDAFAVAGVAGYLYLSIPALTWLVLRGSAMMIGNILQGLASRAQSNFDTQTINQDLQAMMASRMINSERRARGQELINMAEADKLQAQRMAAVETGEFSVYQHIGFSDISAGARGSEIMQSAKGIGQNEAAKSSQNIYAATTQSFAQARLNTEAALALGLMNQDGSLNKENIDRFALTKGIEELTSYLGQQNVQNLYNQEERANLVEMQLAQTMGSVYGNREKVIQGLRAIGGSSDLINSINAGDARSYAEGIVKTSPHGAHAQMYEKLADDVKTHLFESNSISPEDKAKLSIGDTFSEWEGLKIFYDTVKQNKALHEDVLAYMNQNLPIQLRGEDPIIRGMYAKQFLTQYIDTLGKVSRAEAFEMMEKYFGSAHDVLSQSQLMGMLSSQAKINVLGYDNALAYFRFLHAQQMLAELAVPIVLSAKLTKGIANRIAKKTLTPDDLKALQRIEKLTGLKGNDLTKFIEKTENKIALMETKRDKLLSDIDIYKDTTKNITSKIKSHLGDETRISIALSEEITDISKKLDDVNNKILTTKDVSQLKILQAEKDLLTNQLSEIRLYKQVTTEELNKIRPTGIRDIISKQSALGSMNSADNAANLLFKKSEVQHLLNELRQSDDFIKKVGRVNLSGKTMAAATTALVVGYIYHADKVEEVSKKLGDAWDGMVNISKQWRDNNAFAILARNSTKNLTTNDSLENAANFYGLKNTRIEELDEWDTTVNLSTNQSNLSPEEEKSLKRAQEYLDVAGENSFFGSFGKIFGYYTKPVAEFGLDVFTLGGATILSSAHDFATQSYAHGSGASNFKRNFMDVMGDNINNQDMVLLSHIEGAVSMMAYHDDVYSMEKSMADFKRVYEEGYLNLTAKQRKYIDEHAPITMQAVHSMYNNPEELRIFISSVHEENIGIVGRFNKENLEILRSPSPSALNARINEHGLGDLAMSLFLTGMVVDKKSIGALSSQTLYSKSATHDRLEQENIFEKQANIAGDSLNPDLRDLINAPSERRTQIIIDAAIQSPWEFQSIQDLNTFTFAISALMANNELTITQQAMIEAKFRQLINDMNGDPNFKLSYISQLNVNNLSEAIKEINTVNQNALSEQTKISEEKIKSGYLDRLLSDKESDISASFFVKDIEEAPIILTNEFNPVNRYRIFNERNGIGVARSQAQIEADLDGDKAIADLKAGNRLD
ncbi:conjugal transfer protein TraG N-terminal domain-containing protein [Campylobacter sp. MOP51]|uniref:conjugal transfer protein TraG N-terminal domain-containing protein n=1 Tax=Campylobacter canis TaxID=3378588 RepID=UPI003C6AAE7C